MVRELTDQEREVFERILNGDMIGVVPATYDGQDTAAIAVFGTSEDGEEVTSIMPLAVLLTEPMARLTRMYDAQQEPAKMDITHSAAFQDGAREAGAMVEEAIIELRKDA